MKKKILISLSALLLISTITTGCGKTAEVKNGAKVAVSTNEEKITATEYYDEIKKDSISKLINMIDKGILEKKYKSDDKENEAVKKQIDQIKQNYGSNESTYKSVLQSYFGVSSEDELEDMLRLEYKRNEAVKDYIKKNIKDDEIKKYYEENIYGEVKASQILISSSAKSNATDDEKAKAEEKAKKKAEEIIKKLNKGEDFAKLAKKYSDDDATKSNGGDLGYFDLSDMEETFGNAVKKLKVNEYTKDPVKTTYGYHIVLKTGEKDKPKLNKVKSKIKDKLTDEKINSSNTIYYETLMNIREDEKIKWNDDSLKRAYEDYMNNLIKQADSSTTSTNN
jgi:foldase protein PrsA